ncbi:Ni/Fe hydrogenase [Sporanaerobium hydrogeniformans]|uniref:Ni/Fe hydrogenase n=1 Tax=Sporanaerobium hydrogeniformans TaxID=3072179 RepID=A0AC61DFS2_9FIRM|nr:hydrogenase small subunit [Sporanaerobium hydrogeniformans]PHV71868.1 Ni/Fe hydrogenase [Sporanaerobium hydrogeniformans]
MSFSPCPMFYIQTPRKSSSKINCIWLETSGCFGEVISFLNGEHPGPVDFLQDMCHVVYFGSLMGDEGEAAYTHILEVLKQNEPLLFIVDGAIPLKDQGLYTVVVNYQNKPITALELVKQIAPHADYIIAAGTCACFGGPTAARPNISDGKPLSEILSSTIIHIPGCPSHPIWILGTIGYILQYGIPKLDNLGRPLIFFDQKIHEHCPRRSYFDQKIFAKNFGDPECLFQLGCRGPVTATLCPLIRWNQSNNWPIGANTTCIGCANRGFPDQMEPFYSL